MFQLIFFKPLNHRIIVTTSDLLLKYTLDHKHLQLLTENLNNELKWYQLVSVIGSNTNSQYLHR